MSRTGRPPSTIKRLETKIRLRESIIAPLDLLCLDPLRGKVTYGLRSHHVETALLEYFQKHYPALYEGIDKLG